MDIAQVLAVWLHTLAFVIAWGYYGVLARMILPALGRSLDPVAQAATLLAVERRALPLVIASFVLFTVTGTYLLVIDPQYTGLGDVFANTWTVLLLVKHVLVAGLVVLAVIVDHLIRTVGDPANAGTRESDLRLARLGAEGATGLGALIALLTAAAQATA